MGNIVNFVTDSVGNLVLSQDFDFSIGDSGHVIDSIPLFETMPLKALPIQFTHFLECKYSDTRIQCICESFVAIGGKMDFKVKVLADCDAKYVEERGEIQASGARKVRYFGISFNIHGKECEIRAGNGVIKHGILDGKKFTYYRNVMIFKRYLKD